MELLHDRPADTTADARGHFNEAVVQVAVFNVAQGGDAVLHAVDGEIRIPGLVAFHGFQDTARRREKTRAALGGVVAVGLEHDAGLGKPSRQLLKGQNGVRDAR